MKNIITTFLMLPVLLFAGCTADNAVNMFETAQFEELQNNNEHAEELYRKIIKEYPDSEHAGKAKERLLELEVK